MPVWFAPGSGESSGEVFALALCSHSPREFQSCLGELQTGTNSLPPAAHIPQDILGTGTGR